MLRSPLHGYWIFWYSFYESNELFDKIPTHSVSIPHSIQREWLAIYSPIISKCHLNSVRSDFYDSRRKHSSAERILRFIDFYLSTWFVWHLAIRYMWRHLVRPRMLFLFSSVNIGDVLLLIAQSSSDLIWTEQSFSEMSSKYWLNRWKNWYIFFLFCLSPNSWIRIRFGHTTRNLCLNGFSLGNAFCNERRLQLLFCGVWW